MILKKRLLVGIVSVMTTLTSYGTPLNTYERDFEAKNGVVAAAKPEASKVGVEILKKGGNAVDAAVAAAFAVGVLEPNASGIGGGGFMLIKPAHGESVIIDFREEAPGKATPDMYTLDENGKAINHESTVGGKAVGVPGETTGLLTALKKYGTMSRREVMQPAIDFAYNGIPVTVNLATIISDNYEKISKYPATAKIYLNDGLPYEVGDKIKNIDYGKTLEKIADKGASAFYRGE
ncbi:MAG: gamma-glutamyltransferase, partial [Fusobacterium sp. JB021]|nr:gamma-glutamyltransferase [Fusobacterium sp. JB021]